MATIVLIAVAHGRDHEPDRLAGSRAREHQASRRGQLPHLDRPAGCGAAVVDGVVTLYGSVRYHNDTNAIVHMAANACGVVNVIDRLVSQDTRPEPIISRSTPG